MRSVSARDVAALRLVAQGVADPSDAAPVDTAVRMLAQQGQDLGAVRWAIACRTATSTMADVDAAFSRGELVRTWTSRGTLHAATPAGAGGMLDLTAERTLASTATRRRQLGLTTDILDRAAESAEVALADGPLTRDGLAERWSDAGMELRPGWAYHLLFWCSLQRITCLGPMDSRGEQLVVPGSGLTATEQIDARWLVLGYLAGRGPASDRDLAWWSGLPLGVVRAGVAAAGDAIDVLDLDGVPLLCLAALAERLTGGRDGLDDALRTVALLPAFDETILGYQRREPLLAPQHFERIVPGGNGVFRPTVVARGAVRGTWSRRNSAAGTVVSLDMFDDAPTPRGTGPALRRYAHALGGEVRLDAS